MVSRNDLHTLLGLDAPVPVAILGPVSAPVVLGPFNPSDRLVARVYNQDPQPVDVEVVVLWEAVELTHESQTPTRVVTLLEGAVQAFLRRLLDLDSPP